MRAAVLGSPIRHSLSPRLHRAAYAALGLDWAYDAVEVTTADLPGFLDGLGPEWAGLSLTMPLKRAVLPLLTAASGACQVTAVCNTVTFDADRMRVGHNTDVGGMVAALGESGVAGVRAAVVLGGGATARSAVAALAALGCRDVRVATRSRAPDVLALAERLGATARAARLEPAALAGADLVVSTLPPGAADALAAAAESVPALLDVAYGDVPTALEVACRGVVVPGRALLLHQAAEQVTLMTGRTAPLEVMRAALKPSGEPTEG